MDTQGKQIKMEKQKKMIFHDVIITWNILSNFPMIIQSTKLAQTENGQKIFQQSFLKNRIQYILQKLSQFIFDYKSPILCLQEVNNHFQEEYNFQDILTKFFQKHYYKVITYSYGEFSPIYGELGLLTAIPIQKYEMIDLTIQKIHPNKPNVYIYTKLKTHDFKNEISIVNTHFPALIRKPEFMREYTKRFLYDMSQKDQNHLLLCGDFNTMYTNDWFEFFQQKKFKTFSKEEILEKKISHISLQKDKKRFQGFIDYIFWTSSLHIDLHLDNLIDKKNTDIIPNQENPSDHIPLIADIFFN